MLKIISGGQTGVDIAALRAAKACELETGGFIGKGFRTESGPHEEYAELFGLIELDTDDYPTRTKRNVKEADSTLVFTTKWPMGDGSRLAANTAKEKFPCRVYFLRADSEGFVPYQALFDPVAKTWALRSEPANLDNLVQWLAVGYPYDETVNIAGNRDADERAVEAWLTRLLMRVKELGS